ncbi:MAG: hypothetical protein M3Y22_12430, partial [Pseudomonadota bacterium]|nr:hypothetical protein [Pseudomonadota bacterium]
MQIDGIDNAAHTHGTEDGLSEQGWLPMSSAPHDSSEIKLKYGNSEWVAFWPVDAESYLDDHEWGDDDGWAMRIGILQTGVWLQHDGKGGHIPNEEG